MEVYGKTPINPVLFITGKAAGYITWIVLFLAISGFELFPVSYHATRINIAYIILGLGVLFLFLSLIYLGKNVRMGIPAAKTKLKTNGIYRISRNPMYLGLTLITSASIIYTLNIFIFLAGVYSFYVYHQIILSEEKFLEKSFGKKYLDYKKKVRRYI